MNIVEAVAIIRKNISSGCDDGVGVGIGHGDRPNAAGFVNGCDETSAQQYGHGQNWDNQEGKCAVNLFHRGRFRQLDHWLA